MDHRQAQEQGAVERYLLGELDPETRDAFEEHFFGCGECAGDVRNGAVLRDLVQELMPVEAVRQPAVSHTPAARRAWRALFWPVPAGALATAAALLIVVLYQGAVALPRLRQEAARMGSIQAVPWRFLSVSRAAPQVVSVAKTARHVGLTLSRSSAVTFAYYHCTLSGESGRVVRSSVVAAPAAGEELELLLPLAHLTPGDYVLVVAGMTSETTDATDPAATQYRFTLRYQEGAL